MIQIPQAVGEIIRRLNTAGYEAFAVGGCVRDALRGVRPNDWDITTSALPQQTVACFSGERIIETGIKHGTVALLQNGEIYEITTYRMDGEYADARHPKQVSFVQNLTLDLARRDFTVNAMAYHPLIGLVDPFGGEQDLKKRILRCVGNPGERFTEDALRIMRALRFASTLAFSIEPETAEAIHRLKDRLSLIAVERIAVELNKLLCGNAVKPILTAYRDVICTVIPELERNDQGKPWEKTVEAIDCMENDLLLRLTMLLYDASDATPKIAESLLRRLRYDTVTVKTISLLIVYFSQRPQNRISVKKLLSELGSENFFRLLQLQRAEDSVKQPQEMDQIQKRYRQCKVLAEQYLEQDICLSVRQLAVTGDDLLKLGIPKGRQIGQTLQILLKAVLEERVDNQKNALLLLADQQKMVGT